MNSLCQVPCFLTYRLLITGFELQSRPYSELIPAKQIVSLHSAI